MILFRQRIYANRDYADLTKIGKRELRAERNLLAKTFRGKIKAARDKYYDEIKRIDSLYKKDSDIYKSAAKKAEDAWKRDLEKLSESLKAEKDKSKYILRKGQEPGPVSKISEFMKKNKKGLLIGTGVAAGSGLIYGGVKLAQNQKSKKRADEVRRQVLGDVDKKKKQGN